MYNAAEQRLPIYHCVRVHFHEIVAYQFEALS